MRVDRLTGVEVQLMVMVHSVITALCLIALAACTEPNPLYCGDGECSDPAFPYCDVDGLVGGKECTCIAVACSGPGAFVTCKGDKAVACNDAMSSYEITACDDGCNDASQ